MNQCILTFLQKIKILNLEEDHQMIYLLLQDKLLVKNN